MSIERSMQNQTVDECLTSAVGRLLEWRASVSGVSSFDMSIDIGAVSLSEPPFSDIFEK